MEKNMLQEYKKMRNLFSKRQDKSIKFRKSEKCSSNPLYSRCHNMEEENHVR